MFVARSPYIIGKVFERCDFCKNKERIRFMTFSKTFKVSCCLSLSLLMTDIPALAAANSSMISTSSVVAQLDRGQTEAKLHDLFNRSDVQKAMVERGLSPDEVSSRLASLSEAELRQLSSQVEYAKAGGDILVAILIVVLIIYFIKRI
jgi:hypothetical protein